MGRLLKLTGVTITDATAPVIPHSAGLAGYTRRFYAGALAGNAGDTLSQVPSLLDTGITLTRADGSARSATLADDSGVRALQMPVLTSGYGSVFFSGDTRDSGDTNAVSMAAVVKISTANFAAAGVNGFALGRAGDGSFSFGAAQGGGGSGYQISAGNVNWALLIGVSPGGASVAAPVFYANGLKVTATGGNAPIVPNATSKSPILYSSNITTTAGPLIAEFVTWPFAMNDTQAAAVRTALKAKYTALP